MPGWLQAGLWGFVGGAALVLGAAIAWFLHVPQRIIAWIMAFGAGVLISALAFELVDEALRQGGLTAVVVGFLAGAAAYTVANVVLARRGAEHRKRSGGQQPSEDEQAGSGTAIAVGALLDGIPESVVLGLSLLGGGGVSPAVLAAVFISNVPEGLSSAAGIKRAGRSAGYVFGLWTGIAVAGGLAAMIGYVALAAVSPAIIAVITAIAAGAILAMLADTDADRRRHACTSAALDSGRTTTAGPPAPPAAHRVDIRARSDMRG